MKFWFHKWWVISRLDTDFFLYMKELAPSNVFCVIYTINSIKSIKLVLINGRGTVGSRFYMY